MVKNLPAKQEGQVQSVGQEDPLEKDLATHSSILAGRIPRIEGLGAVAVAASAPSPLARTPPSRSQERGVVPGREVVGFPRALVACGRHPRPGRGGSSALR